jgi:enoyl-CoA hydratase/carnithine racemase
LDKYPSFQTLKIHKQSGVVSVTIDNPPINLMDRIMIRDLRALLDALESDADCRVAVFRSANPDFFISHFDLKIVLANLAKAPAAPPQKADKLNSMNAMFERYRTLDKATIAVIEGRTAGAGTEFAHALDMQFAAKGKAFISQFEVALGLLPGGTGTQRLPRLMNRSRALEMILGCDELDAETAERYGCVNRALAPEEIGAFVDRLARRIASFPAAAIALSKKAVDAALADPMPGLLEESDLATQLLATSEVKRRFEKILSLGAQTPDFERDLVQHLPRLHE